MWRKYSHEGRGSGNIRRLFSTPRPPMKRDNKWDAKTRSINYIFEYVARSTNRQITSEIFHRPIIFLSIPYAFLTPGISLSLSLSLRTVFFFSPVTNCYSTPVAHLTFVRRPLFHFLDVEFKSRAVIVVTSPAREVIDGRHNAGKHTFFISFAPSPQYSVVPFLHLYAPEMDAYCRFSQIPSIKCKCWFHSKLHVIAIRVLLSRKFRNMYDVTFETEKGPMCRGRGVTLLSVPIG